MGYYRKIPMTVEARQTGQSYDEDCEIMAWCGGYYPEGPDDGAIFAIATLEGPHIVRHGAWVVKGYAGEFWAIDPDIFAATYEVVEAWDR